MNTIFRIATGLAAVLTMLFVLNLFGSENQATALSYFNATEAQNIYAASATPSGKSPKPTTHSHKAHRKPNASPIRFVGTGGDGKDVIGKGSDGKDVIGKGSDGKDVIGQENDDKAILPPDDNPVGQNPDANSDDTEVFEKLIPPGFIIGTLYLFPIYPTPSHPPHPVSPS